MSPPHLFLLLCPTESYLGTERSRDGATNILKRRWYPVWEHLSRDTIRSTSGINLYACSREGLILPRQIQYNTLFMNMLLHPLLRTRPLAEGFMGDIRGSIFPEYPNTPNPQDNRHLFGEYCYILLLRKKDFTGPKADFLLFQLQKGTFLNCLFLCHYCAWMDYIKGLWYVQVQMGFLKWSNAN